jgi:hypothetical protein
MTMDPNDPNRPLGTDPYYNNPARVRDDDGVGWGLPAAVAAVVLIIGGMFLFASSGERSTTTAANEAPVTRTAPVQKPAPLPPTTPPVTAPKQ